MKGVQYRLIIYGLVFILGVLLAYSLIKTSESDSNQGALNDCIKEKQVLYEQRIDPSVINKLESCESESNLLSSELTNLKSNFTNYCGMFGVIPTSADAGSKLRKVERVRFETNIGVLDIPFGSQSVNYCSNEFQDLMNDDSFYSSGENHKCGIIGMEREGYTLNLNCFCGYYTNPITNVVLPQVVE